MIKIGDSINSTINYEGGQSSGKITYNENDFSFVPNSFDNLTKGLAAKSKRQGCTFRYDVISLIKNGGFLFFKVIAIKLIIEDGTEESLSTQKTNDVFDFLKTKVSSSAIK